MSSEDLEVTNSDTEESSENEDMDQNLERNKRSTGYAWCGVDSEVDNAEGHSSFAQPNFNSNPKYGPRMQLFCKTNWMIALYSENDVRGSTEDTDIFTFFELSSAGMPGDVRIQCIENRLYLAMKKSGRLYGEPDPSKENTIFIESLSGSYNNYLSRRWAHLGYYIGLRRSGKIKKGPKTGYGQKAIQFLPRRTNIE